MTCSLVSPSTPTFFSSVFFSFLFFFNPFFSFRAPIIHVQPYQSWSEAFELALLSAWFLQSQFPLVSIPVNAICQIIVLCSHNCFPLILINKILFFFTVHPAGAAVSLCGSNAGNKLYCMCLLLHAAVLKVTIEEESSSKSETKNYKIALKF